MMIRGMRPPHTPIGPSSARISPKEPAPGLPIMDTTVSAGWLTMAQMTPAHWVPLQQQLGLTGMTESLAASVSLEQIESDLLVFHYTENQRAVLTEVHRERIAGALEHYFSATLRVEFTESRQTQETPFEYLQRKKAERMARAVVDMQNDPVVQRLISQFDGRLELDTVLPIDPN